jgi:hypothetical protein
MYVFDNAIELARKNEYMEVVEYLKSKRTEQLNNTKTPDLTKSCRERNDHFQNCNTCPDGFCCDNTNLLANPLYRTQKEMDDLDKKTYKFVEAVQNGDFQAAADAYIAGANIHWKDEWALRWAAATGNMEMIILLAGDDGALLTEDDADIHALNDQAIRLARQYGHTEVVEYLKSKGAGEMNNVKTPDLTKSCRERNDHFQNCDSCPDGSCGDNTNPVASSLYHTQEEMDELDEGTYKFIEAVESKDFLAMSDAILSLGANIHWKDEWALRWAAATGDIRTVSFLVNMGAYTHALNDDALNLARKNGHDEMVEFLTMAEMMGDGDEGEMLETDNENGNVLGLSQKDTIKLIINLLESLLKKAI